MQNWSICVLHGSVVT